ncbi:ATP-dependent DNA helicase PIF1-like protein, partial [Tanacetum coccineum]
MAYIVTATTQTPTITSSPPINRSAHKPNDDTLIPDSDDHVGSIIHETYPDLLQNLYDPDYFQERAILAPNHELVDMINDRMLSLIPGDEKTYNSFDTVGVADVDTN